MLDNSIAIQLKNVTKTYQLYRNDKEHLKALVVGDSGVRKNTAINNVSFTVKRGESVALFGRNGAGKSTVLKMITGVTYPTEGIIRVNGRVSASSTIRISGLIFALIAKPKRAFIPLE